MPQNTDIEYRPTEKPLNQSQLKNLKELVQGDFADLKQRLYTDIDRRVSKRVQEIEERYDQQFDLGKAREKFRNEARKAEDRLAKVLEDLRVKGIHCESEAFRLNVYVDALSQKGREGEVQAANRAGDRLKQQVRMVLGSEERGVMRQVLLQGISAVSALELIKDLPDVEDVMSLVAAELQMTSQDDLTVLMTEDELTQSKALEKGSE